MSFDPSRWLQEYVNRPSFVQRYPYYAFTLASMKVVSDPAVQVMGVSASNGKFYLHVNIDFFARQPQFLDGVLLHEVHHVVLGHVTEPRFRNRAHPDLIDLAMEMSANEFIREKLPLQPILWQDYASLGIQRGQSTLERYEILHRARQEGRNIPHGKLVDDHIRCGVDVTLGPAILHDGIGTTHADVQVLLKDAVSKAAKHTPLNPGEAISAGKIAGCDPATLIERLNPMDEAHELERCWKTAIQMFVQVLRTPTHQFSRPNRRFPELVGQVAGRVYSPGASDMPRLVLAIDTSASMTSEELHLIARQFRPLSTLSKILVVECDAAIHRIYPFRGTIDCVYGRGGTDFRPLFESRDIREYRPNGMIIFTDGDGPFPASDPGIKTLWILTKGGEFSCPWGHQAHLRTHSLDHQSIEIT